MFLLGKKIRGRSIQSPFGGVLPAKLEDQVQDDLVIKLRARTITPLEKDKLYFSHVRLAIYIVGKYAVSVPSKTSDLIGEAMLAIGESIEEAPDKLTDNGFTPFCTARIHSSLSRFISKDRVTGIPKSTYYARRDEATTCKHCGNPPDHEAHKPGGHGFEPIREAPSPVRVISLTRLENTMSYGRNSSVKVEESEDGMNKRIRIRSTRRLEVRQNVKLTNLKEMIAQSIKTTEEEKIVELRTQGYKDVEIADILGISKSQVGLLRARVSQRFEQLEAAERDS